MLYDSDLREPLFEFLEGSFGRVRILEEINISSSRADCVMVTENDLTGIEIKSDADSYARLRGQIEDYDRFFMYNYVLVGSSHALSVEEKVPSYWGIITAEENDGRADFYILRHPKINPRRDVNFALSLLWRPELQNIVNRKSKYSYKYLSKKEVCKRLLSLLSEEELYKEISLELFDRDYTEIFEKINAFRTENGKKKRRKNKRSKRISKRKSFLSEMLMVQNVVGSGKLKRPKDQKTKRLKD